MTRRVARIGLALAVSLGLLGLVLSRMDLALAAARLAEARPGWIALSAALMAALMVCRGRRFHALFPEAPIGVVTRACAVQSFALRVTPFRGGELALPWLVSRHAGVELGASVLALVWVRLLDLWVVAGLFLAAATVGVARITGNVWWAAASLFAALTAGVFLFRRIYRWLVSLARVFIHATPLGRAERLRALPDRLGGIGDAVSGLSGGQIASLVLWTCLNWAAVFALFFAILRGLRMEVAVPGAVFGIAAAQLATALPLPSVGSIGVHEAGWVVGFGLVGLPAEDAALSGLAGQILTLLYSAALALPSWLSLQRRANTEAAR